MESPKSASILKLFGKYIVYADSRDGAYLRAWAGQVADISP
jgi:hypothetical protein